MILSKSGFETFDPSLPEDMHRHCMVLLDPTTAMVIAGDRVTDSDLF